MTDAKLKSTRDSYIVHDENNKSFFVTRTEKWLEGDVHWAVFTFNEFSKNTKYDEVKDHDAKHKIVRIVQLNLGVF